MTSKKAAVYIEKKVSPCGNYVAIDQKMFDIKTVL